MNISSMAMTQTGRHCNVSQYVKAALCQCNLCVWMLSKSKSIVSCAIKAALKSGIFILLASAQESSMKRIRIYLQWSVEPVTTFRKKCVKNVRRRQAVQRLLLHSSVGSRRWPKHPLHFDSFCDVPRERKVKVLGDMKREKTALSKCINCVVSNGFNNLQQSTVLHANRDNCPLVSL